MAKGLSDKNRYIQSAKLNGEAYDKAWIEHEDIVNGGVLELTMGANPTDWGSKMIPPSKSKVAKLKF